MDVIHHSEKGYVAGTAGYLFPALGDARPAGGARVLVLTEGGACISATWSDRADYLAWSPMPRRTDYVYPEQGARAPGSGELLLLTKGGICVFGPWVADGRFLGWAPKPTRDHAKESAVKERTARLRLPLAA